MPERPATSAGIEGLLRSRGVRAAYASSLVHLGGLLLLALLMPLADRRDRRTPLVLRIGEAAADDAASGADA
ncbi:MAG: hypothetical protein EBX36_13005, partial [Planctomycetia bacterium]|nr:hypothetical protein [Planctomycetia bacterium]